MCLWCVCVFVGSKFDNLVPFDVCNAMRHIRTPLPALYMYVAHLGIYEDSPLAIAFCVSACNISTACVSRCTVRI